MAPSLEDVSPVAPVVQVKIPKNFRFGSTVLQPPSKPSQDSTQAASDVGAIVDKNGSADASSEDPSLPSLDALEKFEGTFRGFGFNTIFRPNSRTTPTTFPKTPTDPNDDNVLQLNLTNETQVFGGHITHVPNRGLFNQADLDLIGLPYTQSIADAMPPDQGAPPAEPPVIHFETGLWMRVPQVQQMPKLPASFCRMGSIPHGTTINAQGFSPSTTTTGAPTIPSIDITPFLAVGPKNEQNKIPPFASQTADDDASRRLPQDLGPFIANGTITQDILNDVNTILRDANKGKDIIQNTAFTVSTIAPPDTFGGGTSNIGFNVGADGGQVNLQPNGPPVPADAKGGNANAANVTAQYWLSEVRAQVELKPSMNAGDTVTSVSAGPRDAFAEFILDVPVPTCDEVVTVVYTQIQYSQVVFLDFNSLSWPHVTVGTLAPAVDHEKPKLSAAIEKAKKAV